MTEDEINEYVSTLRNEMVAAKRYADENPSPRVDGAKRWLKIVESDPQPKTPVSYMKRALVLERARIEYRRELLAHYRYRKIRTAIDTTTPACEDG